jgi:hypothetical protein
LIDHRKYEHLARGRLAEDPVAMSTAGQGHGRSSNALRRAPTETAYGQDQPATGNLPRCSMLREGPSATWRRRRPGRRTSPNIIMSIIIIIIIMSIIVVVETHSGE